MFRCFGGIHNHLMSSIHQPSTEFHCIGFNPANPVDAFDCDVCDFQGMPVNNDFVKFDNRGCVQSPLWERGQMALSTG